jgi:hypothetical protein
MTDGGNPDASDGWDIGCGAESGSPFARSPFTWAV